MKAVSPPIVPPSPTNNFPFKDVSEATNKDPFKDVSEATVNPPFIETSLTKSLTDIILICIDYTNNLLLTNNKLKFN